MEKQIFKNESPVKRLELLESNAERIELMTYGKKLNEDELTKYRLEFAQKAIEIARKQDELKDLTAQLRQDIKAMTVEYRELLTRIKS
jgi:hypothetical protein